MASKKLGKQICLFCCVESVDQFYHLFWVYYFSSSLFPGPYLSLRSLVWDFEDKLFFPNTHSWINILPPKIHLLSTLVFFLQSWSGSLTCKAIGYLFAVTSIHLSAFFRRWRHLVKRRLKKDHVPSFFKELLVLWGINRNATEKIELFSPPL